MIITMLEPLCTEIIRKRVLLCGWPHPFDHAVSLAPWKDLVTIKSVQEDGLEVTTYFSYSGQDSRQGEQIWLGQSFIGDDPRMPYRHYTN